MRWYHWICAYMIILPWFGLAIIPEELLNGWTYTGIIASVVLGILGCKYLPKRQEFPYQQGPPT